MEALVPSGFCRQRRARVRQAYASVKLPITAVVFTDDTMASPWRESHGTATTRARR